MRALRLDEFAGREGESFELLLEGDSLPFKLTKVQALSASGRDAGAFVLEWRGPADPVLPQSIYTFRQGGEAVEMFIVPLAKDGNGTRYEAVFN
jgi:hypothetical protein